MINKLNNIQEGIGLLVSMQLSELIEMDEDGVVLIKITEEDEDNG